VWHREGTVVGTFLDGATDAEHAQFATYALTRPQFTSDFLDGFK
jgi:hypothetical protein